MADTILTKKEILSILDNGQINAKFSNYDDSAFLPIPLAIDVIERAKKRGTKTPTDLKKFLNNIPECVSILPLSQSILYEAMNEPDFSKKHINNACNPFEFATEACIYEKDSWWDRGELLESIMELSWL